MRKFLALITLCLAIGTWSDSGFAWLHNGAVVNANIPFIVAGSFAPQSQTPLMPNVSTDGPRCLDSTWGACDGTQHCIAPTSGTPVESCQPPQQLVTVSGTGNGTTATILYTSYAQFIYPTGAPFIVSGATQSNWNTPTVHITGYTQNAVDSTNCSGGTSITLALSSNPFVNGRPIYVNGLTGISSNTLWWSFGWSGQGASQPPPAGDPNGKFTAVGISGSNVTYCTTSNPTSGTAATNQDGFLGTVVSPDTVTASSCVGVNCSVTVTNAFTCASSCVSSTTQIAAGQFTDVIISPHFGEEVNFVTYTSGNATSCILAKTIGSTSQFPDGIRYAGAELDGGSYVQATAQTVDPRGAGQSGLSISAVHPYCVKANTALLADGEHEIRWIVCPIVGYCGQLTSVIAADATNGSVNLAATNHGLGSWAITGITYGPPGSTTLDPQFPAYDWRYNTTTAGDASNGILSATATASGSQINVSYPLHSSVPAFAAGQTVAVFGLTTGTTQQCGVSAGSHAGTFPSSGVNTLTLTGTCAFAVGSTVNIAGIVSSGGNGYTWNGTLIPVQSPAVNCVAGSGACTLNVAGLTSATYTSGGTVNPNYNGSCVVAASPAPTTTSFSCPNTAAANATPATGGQIMALGNEFVVVGGGGDNIPPYTPYPISATNNSPFSGQMTGEAVALIPAMNAFISGTPQVGIQDGTVTQNQTGCPGKGTCGRTASATATMWIWRKDAGIDERKAVGAVGGLNPNDSFFFFTNNNSTIQALRSHVDAWNTSSTAGPCNEAAFVAAGSPLTSYSGTTCASPRQAENSLIASASALTQTLSNAGGCLIFSAASNNGTVPLHVGEPINLASGLDTNSSPLLAQWGLYWIKATGLGAGTGVSIAATPTGACINETAATISGTVTFVADLSFDSVLFECSGTCSNSNPEQYIAQGQGISGSLHYTARAGWLNFSPNTANGATSLNTSMWPGPSGWFSGGPSQGGRGRETMASNQPLLTLTSAIAVTPTPPISTVTGGSLASCTAGPGSGHQCETLTFAAWVDPATKIATGATFQVPTSTGSPGQSIAITGITSSATNTCTVTSASSVSGVSFTLNFTPSASCVAPVVGSLTTVSGVTVTSAGNKVAWNGNSIKVTSSTSGSATFATTSNETYVSGGSITSNWNCGSSVANACPAMVVGGALAQGIIASTTTSVTFINDNALASSTWVSGGSIIPTSIVLELAPGTFSFDGSLNPNGLCADPTTAISHAPSAGSQVCIGASAGAYNGTSDSLYTLYTIGINDGRNTNLATARCMQAETGAGAANTETSVQKVIWSTNHSTLNDIVVLSNSGTFGTQSFNAFASCGTGPFIFSNNPYYPQGTTTDLWEDGANVTGPWWSASYTGVNGASAYTGTYYATNTIKFNTFVASDNSSYAWGDITTYNNGDCINNTQIAVSVNCQGAGPSLIPVSLGGQMDATLQVPWVVITGGLDATGAATTCGGIACIGNAGSTDSHTATTVLLTTTQPSISSQSGFVIQTACGTTTLATAGSATPLANPFTTQINSTVSPYTINVPGTTWNTSCLLGSGHPGAVAYLYNTRHIDFDFFSYSAASAPANGGAYSDWVYWKDFVQENVTCNCGTTEGIFLQGANMLNWAFEDSNYVLNQGMYPGGFSFFGMGVGAGYTVNNFIARNSAISGGVADTGNGLFTIYSNVYMININGQSQANFPSAAGYPNPAFTGFWQATAHANNPFPGSTSVGGAWSNVAISPTAARGTNSTTGVPNVAAQQNANSFYALPWYGVTDSGLGTY